MSKKSKLNSVQVFEDAVYGVNYLLIYAEFAKITPVCKQLHKNLIQFLQNEGYYTDQCAGRCTPMEQQHGDQQGLAVVIYINKAESKNALRQVAAHECLHATFAIMRIVGIPLENSDAEEAVTYYQDWLVRTVWEMLGV